MGCIGSIIIPFHGNISSLNICLRSILNTIPLGVEVIVVANNEEPSKTAMPKTLPKGPIEWLEIHENLGYPKAINIGSEYAKGEMLIFCDDDIRCLPGWYEAHFKAHNELNAVGITGAKLLDQETGRIWSFGMTVVDKTIIHPFRDRPRNFQATLKDKQFACICSANMMINKTLFKEVGGLNESLKYYFSDPDLCHKVGERGLRCYALANCICIHRGRGTVLSRAMHYLSQEALYRKLNESRQNKELLSVLEKYKIDCLNSPRLKDGCYFINMTNRLDKEVYYNFIAEHVKIISRFEFPNIPYNLPSISLTDILGYNISILNHPIVYHCDRYYSLKDNFLWKQLRQGKEDVVIDRYANILSLEAIEPNGP